jgi:hypothetical protein
MNLSWGTPGIICAPIVGRIIRSHDWQTFDHEMGEVSREAIRAHPIEFFYRFLWNLDDFLFRRASLFKTMDLDPLLLDSDRSHLRIDRAKAGQTRAMDPLEPDSKAASIGRLSVQGLLGVLRGFVLNPVVVLLLVFSFFLTICQRGPQFILLLFLIWAGQIFLTLLTANALYDRYYLVPEALAVILIAAGLSHFAGLNRQMKYCSLIFFGASLPLVAGVFFLFREVLERLLPVLDSPVLGLSASDAAHYQSTVLAFLLSSAVAASGLGFLRSRNAPGPTAQVLVTKVPR